MKRPDNYPPPLQHGWAMTAAAGAPLRGFDDLRFLTADLDEIAARNGEPSSAPGSSSTVMVPVACDPAEVFRNYNKGRGTPVRYRSR